jgi:hypothetical protein
LINVVFSINGASYYNVTDLFNTLPGNRFVNTKTGNNRMGIVFCAVRAEQNHAAMGSLLPGDAAVNMHPQQWETVFSVESVERSCLKNERRSTMTPRVVGGDEKGSLKTETVKYGRDPQGTRTREKLRWRGRAAYTKDRPVLSSERALHENTVTVKQ